MAVNFVTDKSVLFNMAASLVGMLGATDAKDVIAIFDDNFEQVLATARPIRCVIKEGAAMMQHPVESGQTITDHRIMLPVEVDLVMVTLRGEEKTTYTEMKQLYLRAAKLSLQTKVATFSNLYISDMPHKQDTEMFDVIQISLKLKEVQFVEPQFSTLPPSKVKDKKDSGTVKRGAQTPKEPTAAQKEKSSSILFGLFN